MDCYVGIKLPIIWIVSFRKAMYVWDLFMHLFKHNALISSQILSWSKMIYEPYHKNTLFCYILMPTFEFTFHEFERYDFHSYHPPSKIGIYSKTLPPFVLPSIDDAVSKTSPISRKNNRPSHTSLLKHWNWANQRKAGILFTFQANSI